MYSVSHEQLVSCNSFRQVAVSANWMRFAAYLIAFFAAHLIPCLRADAEQQHRMPNIVLMIADDLGYGELGCQGNPQVPTPHIDALAESGVRFTQAYVTAPNCSPSRAGLFTGRTPTRFGYEFNPIGARNEDPGTGLPRGERTLAEALHDRGYTTGLIGKWHLGGAADFHPQRHGFDEFFGFLHEGHYYAPSPWADLVTMLRRKTLPTEERSPNRIRDALFYTDHMGHNEPAYDADNPIYRGGSPITESEYLTDAFSREAIAFIERYRETPFFIALTYNAVHSPLQAKSKTLASLEHIDDLHRRIFAAMLVDLDHSVGAVVGALERFKLREQTLVIFLSDNGGPTRELTSSNLPLRDGKGSMYEGGLRVPMIASWPGHLPVGSVCDDVVSSLDIYPTCTDIAKAPRSNNLEGKSLLGIVKQENPKESGKRTLFWRQGHRAALRDGDWKIVANRREKGVRRWELYHIPQDIGEKNDLAEEMPGLITRLRDKWDKLNDEMASPLF